jgi:chitinase
MLDATRALQRLTALTPTVTAQANAPIVENGSTVILTGSAVAKAGGNTNFSYRWQQIAGASATLSSATSAQATFTAPNGSRMSFRLTATDADGFASSGTVDVRSNGTPVLAVVPTISASAGSTVSFKVSATDPDKDTVTYAATGLPSGATLGSITGEFSWPNSSAGTFTISVTASDGLTTSAAQNITINVTAPRGGGGSFDLWTVLILALALWWRLRSRRHGANEVR